VTSPGPDAGGGPERFIRNWLRFNENRLPRTRTLWKLIATVALLLIASALLASRGHLQR
jgi:hypothetical protein